MVAEVAEALRYHHPSWIVQGEQAAEAVGRGWRRQSEKAQVAGLGLLRCWAAAEAQVAEHAHQFQDALVAAAAQRR